MPFFTIIQHTMRHLFTFLSLLAAGSLYAQTIVTVSDGSCFDPPFQFQGCGAYNTKNQYCSDNTSDLRIRWTGTVWEIILLTGGGNQIYYISANINPTFPNDPPTDGWGLYSNPTPPPFAAPCANAGSLAVFSLALPVELIRFFVQVRGSAHELSWMAASERNNRGYYVERRTEEQDAWETLGFVAANSGTSQTGNYRFADQRPVKGANYYRLKQVDLDGVATYSPVVQAHYGEVGRLSVQPNPAQESFSILLEDMADMPQTLRLFDPSGRLVHQRVFQEVQPVVEVGDWPNGVYLLEVASEQTLLRSRLVVQH